MASSSLESPTPLKSKLPQVKYLLDDANKRLQEEASKYKIFATKTSAAGSTTIQQQQHHGDQEMPTDLIRTMSDISTLKSVLSCPIFNRIVNVTDSLDKLSYQLNLHPSIGPADINIDSNGELILAPPIEPTTLNNLINSKLDEYSDHSNNSPRVISPQTVPQNTPTPMLDDYQHHSKQSQATNSNFNASSGNVDRNNGFSQLDQQQQHVQHQQQEHSTNIIGQQQQQQQYESRQHNHGVPRYVPFSTIMVENGHVSSPLNAFDTEKLVSNGKSKTHPNSNKPKIQQQETDMDVENSSANVGQRIYKSGGQFTLNQVAVSDDQANMRGGFQGTQHMGERAIDPSRNGYSNELYLNQSETMAIDQQIKSQSNGQNHDSSYTKKKAQGHTIVNANGKTQSSGVHYNRGSCSPSTSAGSTVRLADDCDSGASSYQSQTAKASTPYSSYPYKNNNDQHVNDENTNVLSSPNEDRVDSIEQELSEILSPEMEKIRVTLEKDDNGLGITIAGYTCEKEEISGIFIKSITPNSPADRSGKIRTLDQIFAVNGRELLGYSNPDAVSVLRKTGKQVTLELMRYLAESKYRKLQSALDHAVPTLNTSSSRRLSSSSVNVPTQNNGAQSSTNTVVSPTKSSIPVSKMRENNQSPLKSPLVLKPTFVQVSNVQRASLATKPAEYIEFSTTYKVEAAANNNATPIAKDSTHKHSSNQSIDDPQAKCLDSQSQIPVAAQRGGTNKVIETRQGHRNTVDIRSQVCHTTTATYVNKIADGDYCDSAKKSTNDRIQNETSDEFSRLIRPEWERDTQIIEIYKDSSQGLGFTVKEYANPNDQKQSIIMITSLTPGGIAERDGRLSCGDLLIFVDATNLEGASLSETVKALKNTNGQVRLGVLKLKRN